MEVLIIAVLIGLIPATIAKNKGRSFGLWWFYGAALFIIALPHALIMKENNNAIEQQQTFDRVQPRTRNSVAMYSDSVEQIGEEFWALALAEYEGDERKSGLWSRLFAENSGDENIAKSNYIKIRSKELYLDAKDKKFKDEQLALLAWKKSKTENFQKIRDEKMKESLKHLDQNQIETLKKFTNLNITSNSDLISTTDLIAECASYFNFDVQKINQNKWLITMPTGGKSYAYSLSDLVNIVHKLIPLHLLE